MQGYRYLDDTAILRLDAEKCIGCGNCLEVCPHRLFTLNDGKARITDGNACMECGACARNCPVEALFVNPDDGCGCAHYIINSWLARVLNKQSNGCGC